MLVEEQSGNNVNSDSRESLPGGSEADTQALSSGAGPGDGVDNAEPAAEQLTQQRKPSTNSKQRKIAVGLHKSVSELPAEIAVSWKLPGWEARQRELQAARDAAKTAAKTAAKAAAKAEAAEQRKREKEREAARQEREAGREAAAAAGGSQGKSHGGAGGSDGGVAWTKPDDQKLRKLGASYYCIRC